MHQSLVRQELLQVADAVAREKGILKAEVLSAMEEAFAKVSLVIARVWLERSI
jgi:hypothetical protein